MRTRRIVPIVAMLGVVVPLLQARAPGSTAAKVVIKMGTGAPDDSPWHQILKTMGEQWRQSSGGAVELRIYAGGKLGDEPDLIRKMRVGQIQAAAVTAVGLSEIDDSVAALQIPMMFRTYEELDYVRDRMRATLEKRLHARGFEVLNWGDAGWVMFFAKEPIAHPDDLRKMKLFVWAGDPHAVDLWKAGGFRVVPLAATDILPGLQTGLINAFDTTPLAALANQWFGLAPHMLDLRWAPLVGATVITRKAWDMIPEGSREAIRRAADEAGERLRGEIRATNEKALEAMAKRGLTIHRAGPELISEWQRAAEEVYPKIRGTLVPADMFDEVRRLRDEHRKSAPAAVR